MMTLLVLIGLSDSKVKLGEKLFKEKGCTACHTIGKGKLVGPDLKGVFERRSEKWVRAMISNPDSMLKHDKTAKKLLKKYGARMPKVEMTEEELDAIVEYLKQFSKKK